MLALRLSRVRSVVVQETDCSVKPLSTPSLNSQASHPQVQCSTNTEYESQAKLHKKCSAFQGESESDAAHYFRPILAESDSCLVIYETPDTIIQALRGTRDTVALGRAWTSAILARTPSPGIEIPSTASKDLRDNIEAWGSIAGALASFVRNAGAAGATLYVEIEYDC